MEILYNILGLTLGAIIICLGTVVIIMTLVFLKYTYEVWFK